MAIVIFGYLILSLICGGMGYAFYRIPRISKIIPENTTSIFEYIWTGFFLLIAFLQLYSLLMPIDAILVYLTLPFVIVGIYALWKNRINNITLLTANVIVDISSKNKRVLFVNAIFSKLAVGVTFTLVILFITYIYSINANRTIDHYDAYLYHLAAVKWMKEFATVPGLANLHSRLGFNSSFHLFAAYIDAFSIKYLAVHLATSFLVWLLSIQMFYVLFLEKYTTHIKIYCAISLLYLLTRGTWFFEASAIATDVPASVIFMVFGFYFLESNKIKFLLLPIIAVCAITFKLSMLFAGVLLIPVLISLFFHIKKYSYSTIKTITIVGLSLSTILMLGFVFRNIITSGYLLFPIPITNLHLSWSVPTEETKEVVAVIRAWAQKMTSPQEITKNGLRFWLIPWVTDFVTVQIEFKIIVVSILVFILTGFVYIRKKKTQVIRFFHKPTFLLFCATFLSLCLWFYSAPDLRFGRVFFWIVMACLLILLSKINKSIGIITTTLVFIFFFTFYTKIWFNYSFSKAEALQLVAPRVPKVAPYELKDPKTGKTLINMVLPLEGDWCGEELLCTPSYYIKPIQFREDKNLSKGFKPVKK